MAWNEKEKGRIKTNNFCISEKQEEKTFAKMIRIVRNQQVLGVIRIIIELNHLTNTPS